MYIDQNSMITLVFSHLLRDPIVVLGCFSVYGRCTFGAARYNAPRHDANEFAVFCQWAAGVTLKTNREYKALNYCTIRQWKRQHRCRNTLTLHAEIPPVSGPVQTLVSWTGDDPVRRSTASWHVWRSTMGISMCWSLSGIIGKLPCAVEPHPQSFTFPCGSLPYWASLIGCTCCVNFSGVASLSRPIS